MILGIDLSLTSTGLATHRNGKLELDTITAPNLRGPQRWSTICAHIWALLRNAGPNPLVIIEGQAPTPRQGIDTILDTAGLHAVLAYSLWNWAIVTMYIPPTNLKKYATGNGGASKEDVRVHVDRWAQKHPHIPVAHKNDEADALVLVAMALDQYGAPLVDLPKINRSALAGNSKHQLIWPTYSLEATDARHH